MVQSVAERADRDVRRFGVEKDRVKALGGDWVLPIVAKYAPRVVGFRAGSAAEDKGGADFVVETPSGEIAVDVKVRRQDCRRFGEDDVALEIWSRVEAGVVGWSMDRSKKTDLVVWLWEDMGRTLVLPFRSLCDTMIANVKAWEHSFRVDTQISRNGLDYWTSRCVFVPLRELKIAMAPRLKMRGEVD
jgi:hypothetical protein